MKNISRQLKVLVAEDNAQDFKLITNYLNNIRDRKFDIARATNYEDAQHMLSINNYGLCLCNASWGYKKSNHSITNANQETPVIFLFSGDNIDPVLREVNGETFGILSKGKLNEETLKLAICSATKYTTRIKELEGVEKKYINLFERLQDIIFVADENYRLININHAVTAILGYHQDFLIGKSLLNLFKNPDQAAKFAEALIKKKNILNFEASFLCADGSLKICLLSASLENEDCEKNLIQGSLKDFRDLKKTEESFLRLEKLAGSGRFASIFAHDLRNPLNNINLAIENLLQNTSCTEDDLFFLNIIKRNGERINNLVTDLLTSCRPAEINPQQISLHKLIDNSTERLKATLEEAKISLVKQYAATDLQIFADAAKMEQAILNILENAIESINHETGLIEITTSNYSNKLKLAIKDNGCGISEDIKDKIFEPYFSTKKKASGLGLPSALTILQSHNAKLELFSKETEGTTFLIHFSK